MIFKPQGSYENRFFLSGFLLYGNVLLIGKVSYGTMNFLVAFVLLYNSCCRSLTSGSVGKDFISSSGVVA